MKQPHTVFSKCAILILLGSTLSACGTWDRVKNIGRVPPLTPMESVEVPELERSIGAPIAVQNRGAIINPHNTVIRPHDGTSLWRTGARAFFRDQRATKVGDILTVRIEISDRAQVGNSTSRSRTNSEDAGLGKFFGLETQLNKFLPNAVDPTSLVEAETSSSSSGNGQVQRSENINLTVAAVITQILPNGNLVIQGKQEVRVNFEVRELIVMGIVRPQDISQENTINHSQIAEARISYGGRGQLTDVQQARYGQQLFDALFPF